jgi:uncharacterized HhH-GPD family protein
VSQLTAPASLPFTGDPDADALIARDPMALLLGFLLDQQVTVQKAFGGPLELRHRIGTLDPKAIATLDAERLADAFRRRPALHRFPGSMAAKAQALAAFVADRYDGDAARIWSEATDGRDLERRLMELPGIGEMKAKTLIGILTKRFGVRPPGWEAVAPTWPTLADVDSAEALAAYQAGKRAHKAELRAQGKRV